MDSVSEVHSCPASDQICQVPSTKVPPDDEKSVAVVWEVVEELVQAVLIKSEKATLTLQDKNEKFDIGARVGPLACLLDLPQPEAVDNKETDTGTDMIDYKTATDTEPSDALSCTGSILADDIFDNLQDALKEQEKQASPSSAAFATDKQLDSENKTLQGPSVRTTRVWSLYRENKLLSSESEGSKCDSPLTPINYAELDANSSISISELCKDFNNCSIETSEPLFLQSTCPHLQCVDGKKIFENVDASKIGTVTESIVKTPCKPEENVEYNSSMLTITSVSSQCVESAKENLSFEDSLAAEALKVAEDIFNASQALDDIDIESDSDNQASESLSVGSIGDSLESSNIDEAANPFVTLSSLRQSPPLPDNQSPRSSKTRGHSPSKMNSISAVSIEPVEEQKLKSRILCASSANNINYGEMDDLFKSRTKIQNSSPRDLVSSGDGMQSKCKISEISKDQTPQQKSVESSPKTAPIGLEINHHEAGPDITNDQFQSGEVFEGPSTLKFLSTVGGSHTAQDLKNESLDVKFDPVVGTVSQSDQNMPLPQADMNKTHRKYERSKTLQDINNFEVVLRANVTEYESITKTREENYDMLKSNTTALLESTKQELDAQRQSQQAEYSELKENVKKVEIKTNSIEEKLQEVTCLHL